MESTLAAHGHTASHEVVAASIGPPMLEVVSRLTGAGDRAAREIFEGYLERYEAQAAEAPAMPGAVELLDRLQDEGVTLAVVTNKHQRSARAAIEALGWGDYFEAVCTVDAVPRPKPYPDLAQHALRQLGASPADAAIVGDSELDMACGRNAGLARRVGMTFSRAHFQLVAAGATHTCDTLAEVEAALLADNNGASSQA
jgi:HAD superfamily hydrolase (TIGR01509 family)